MELRTRRGWRFLTRVRLVSVLTAAMFLVSGCSVSNLSEQTKGYVFKPDKNAQVSKQEAFIRDINQLGFTSLNMIQSEAGDGQNCMISPTSLASALSFVSNGASGQTRKQINALINTENLSPEQLSDKYYALVSGFYGRKGIAIIMANSIWVQEGINIEKHFLELAKTRFNAEVQSLNLQTPKAVDTINNWISAKTNGFLEKTLDKISKDAVTLLVNTLYFKGRWSDTFSKRETLKENFTLTNGEVIQVDMMNNILVASYCQLDGLEAIKMPYDGGASMLMIRPEGAINDLMVSLSTEKLQQILEAFEKYQVTVKVPKFAFSDKSSMSEYLKAMGMTEAFTDRADFSDMIQEPPVLISDVIHDCRIELDEEGTIAAAATVVQFDKAMAARPPENRNFYLDKPFVFAIVDDYSGAILFMGKVENPNNK